MIAVVDAADQCAVDRFLDRLLAELHSGDHVLICPLATKIVIENADRRVVLLPPEPSWQAAVDAAVGRAESELIAFTRPGERHPPGALDDLRNAWARDSFGSSPPLGAEGLVQHPAVSSSPLPMHLALPNRVISRRAWLEHRRDWTATDEWLFALPVAGLNAAGSFSRIERPVVELSCAEPGRSVAARPSVLVSLAPWLERSNLARRSVVDSGIAAVAHDVAAAWLPIFLMDAERADVDQWRLLVKSAQESRQDWPDERLASTSSRVLRWLAATERQSQLIALASELSTLGGDMPTRVAQGQVIANWAALPPECPAAVAGLNPAETRLKGRVQRVLDGDQTRRFADLFVTIDNVDLAGSSPRLSGESAAGQPLEIEHLPPDPAATRWLQRRFQSAGEGVFRVEVHGPEAQRVVLRFEVDGLSRTGTVVIPPAPARRGRSPVRVSGVELVGPDRLVVIGSGDLRSLRLEPESPAGSEAWRNALPLEISAAGTSAQFGLTTERFGRPTISPTGRYRLLSTRGDVTATSELRGRAPLHECGESFRMQVDVAREGRGRGADSLRVWLRPPLSDDELGPYAQETMRRHYRERPGSIDPAAYYFETYAGRSATDSPLAIFERLRAVRPGLSLHWGVADAGQWVPEGAIRVVRHSRQWYDVLATAGCLVLNTDVEPWFVKRRGQFVLQCFHGYPAKAMGAQQWRLNELPPREVRVLRQRGVDTWDLIVTPTAKMTRHYREQYGYAGPAVEAGYPRNDLLTGSRAAAVRRQSRAVLGIGPDQTAVLYAPTWRDHLAVRARAAERTDFFDTGRAAAVLGPSHVILMREHRFHPATRSTEGVIDVTDHPEINELILASDVAVLDYSSLRFDYALTGKPMVFLVPDLHQFESTERGFLFPFVDSAPGPLVQDTDEVIVCVRSVADLASANANRLAAFNATYNPHQDGHATERVVTALLRLHHF